MTTDPTLIAARQRVAERYPGCASAILSDDPILNWDRGALVRAALDEVRGEATTP